jgi:hypothetical protein
MSVKKLLAQQEAGFISLHDVLTRMAEIDGASYQQAATVLHRLIAADPDKWLFMWWTKTALHGVRQATNRDESDALACLRQAALSGEPQEELDENEIPF